MVYSYLLQTSRIKLGFIYYFHSNLGKNNQPWIIKLRKVFQQKYITSLWANA